MTTRSGKRYRATASEMATEGDAGANKGMDVSEVMRLFMEDRRQREAEVQAQLELLRNLVEETRGSRRAEMPAVTTLSREDVRPPKLTEEDDIESYLTTFERMMAGYEIRRERWAFKLAPQLTGRAQQAFAAMDPAQASDYGEVKAAILRRYDISEETYRRRLRAVAKKDGESYRELTTRVQDLFGKWTRRCTTMEELKELMMMEQLLNALPHEVRIWVVEREPKTVAELGKLADTYDQARRQLPEAARNEHGQKGKMVSKEEGKRGERRPPQEIRRCHNCGMVGHIARDCRRGTRASGQQPEQARGQAREVRCFNCGRSGHIAMRCPNNALFCRGVQERAATNVEPQSRSKPCRGVTRSGMVNGNLVGDILLDTGCSTTLVRRDLVSDERLRKGEVTVRCAHGDTTTYPLAEVAIEVQGIHFKGNVGVSTTLPVSVLLGTDFPKLMELLGRSQGDALVVTRAQAKNMEVQRSKQVEKGEMSAYCKERESESKTG